MLMDSVGMACPYTTMTRASSGKIQMTGGVFTHMSDTWAGVT